MLDAVLLVLLVYVLFRGWRQGAVSQIAAFGGLVLGLLAGMLVAPLIGGLFVDEPGRGLALLTLALLFMVMLIGQDIGVRIGLRPARCRAPRRGWAPWTGSRVWGSRSAWCSLSGCCQVCWRRARSPV